MKKILFLLLIITFASFSQTSKIVYDVVLHNPKSSSNPMVFEQMQNAKCKMDEF